MEASDDEDEFRFKCSLCPEYQGCVTYPGIKSHVEKKHGNTHTIYQRKGRPVIVPLPHEVVRLNRSPSDDVVCEVLANESVMYTADVTRKTARKMLDEKEQDRDAAIQQMLMDDVTRLTKNQVYANPATLHSLLHGEYLCRVEKHVKSWHSKWNSDPLVQQNRELKAEVLF